MIHHGLADGILVPLLFMRVNIHPVKDQELPELVDRIKEVAQFMRDEIAAFEANGNAGALPVVTMQYFFYGKGSEHRELADHAKESLTFKKDINVCRPPSGYDSDIASFTFADLDGGDIGLQKDQQADVMVRSIIQADSLAPQCSALDLVKKSRCWKNCRPGSDLCIRHSIHEKKGKKVRRCCDEESEKGFF